MKAEIIAIGDEILYGQTLDTNSHWISGELDQINIKVSRKVTIGDNREQILQAFKDAENNADIILITGGLGPTSDDLTKPLLAEYFGVGYRNDEKALDQIFRIFNAAGKEVTELNKKQAELPENCETIYNHLGTAPGMWFDVRGKVFVSMPGVPFEMKGMMTDVILPKLSSRSPFSISHRIVRTIGIGESNLQDIIKDWESALPENVRLAYLPGMGQVKLRLTAIGRDADELDKLADSEMKKVVPLIEKYVYGYGELEIQEFIGQLMMKHNATLSIAESCTGGYLSSLITSIPGSSKYFKGTVVCYDNEVKINQLGVQGMDIERYGAVSEEVVRSMAEGVKSQLNTTLGLAITGIAGPDGGTLEKPVGTVWLAYADTDKTISKKIQLTKNRTLNIQYSSVAAMNLLRRYFKQQ
ncbi:unnamed protein product [Symbiodinium microadriaticum]|nr:unnamed protein product [Symbiodinium microadriaticum]